VALATLDATMTREAMDASLPQPPACEVYAVAAFAPVNPGSGSAGLADGLAQTLDNLIASGKPVALVALGNPYLLRNYPKVAAYLATFSNVPPSEIAAVKALWGEMDIRGHLPVTIPGEARYGEGISLAATRRAPNGANQR
jgi:beta-N-acetylhexosaminidase